MKEFRRVKRKILLILGLFTVLLRCWGGVVFHSHLLLGWGILSLGEILLFSGAFRRSRGLLLLFGYTASVFGVAGGAARLLISRALGFIPVPVSALPAALVLFITLILWEGGGKRFSSCHGDRRLVLAEILTLTAGLLSFFLLVSTLYLSADWGVGDPLMGLALAGITLLRSVPLLVGQTSRFLLGQE